MTTWPPLLQILVFSTPGWLVLAVAYWADGWARRSGVCWWRGRHRCSLQSLGGEPGARTAVCSDCGRRLTAVYGLAIDCEWTAR